MAGVFDALVGKPLTGAAIGALVYSYETGGPMVPINIPLLGRNIPCAVYGGIAGAAGAYVSDVVVLMVNGFGGNAQGKHFPSFITGLLGNLLAWSAVALASGNPPDQIVSALPYFAKLSAMSEIGTVALHEVFGL